MPRLLPSSGPPRPACDPLEPRLLLSFSQTPSGVQWETLSPGAGLPASTGDLLTVNYTGFLLSDGSIFDSSLSPSGSPFTFLLGHGRVIQGWDDGLQGIQPGEERRLLIPAALAYGAQARPGIPAYSDLGFDVQVLSVDPPHLDVSFSNNPINAGQTSTSPLDGTAFVPLGLGATDVHSFTVKNLGNGSLDWGTPALNVTGPAAQEFGVSAISRNSDGVSGTFRVVFRPLVLGSRDAVIEIRSNDPDHPLFTFAVHGDAVTPTLSVDNVAMAEDQGEADFTLRLSVPSGNPVSVAYSTSPGTALAGKDFLSSAGTVTFPAGTTTQIVRIPVIRDLVIEPNETFTLNLSNPSGATLDSNHATATVLNDDGPDLAGTFSVKLSTPLLLGSSAKPVVRVTNSGNLPAAGRTTLRFYASSNMVYDRSDVLLGSAPVSVNLKPGGALNVTVPITFPAKLAPGSWYLLARVDDPSTIREVNEDNNTAATSSPVNLVRRVQDLVPGFAVSPVSGSLWNATLAAAIVNSGTVAASGTGTLKFYASKDEKLDARDILLTTLSARYNLAPGQYRTFQKTAALPQFMPAGEYHLIVTLSGAPGDSNLKNNSALFSSTFTLS